MGDVTEWVKKHPYLTGSLVLGVLVFYFVYRSVAGGSSSGSTQVIQSGPSDALQAANLQAQVQSQAVQAAADSQNNQLNAALAAKQSDNQTALQIAQLQTDAAKQGIVSQAQAQDNQSQDQLAAAIAAIGGQVQAASINAGAQVQLASIQGNTAISLATIQSPIQLAQINAALAAQKDIDQTSVTINGQNTSTDLAKTKLTTDAAVTLGLDTNKTSLGLATIGAGVANYAQAVDLAKTQDINATLVKLGLISADVTNNQTTAALTLGLDTNKTNLGLATITSNTQVDLAKIAADYGIHISDNQAGVFNNLITTNGNIAGAQITLQNNTLKSITDLTALGKFNIGGQGGANTVSIWSSLFGQPSVGVAAQQGANQAGNTWGAILQGVASIFKSVPLDFAIPGA